MGDGHISEVYRKAEERIVQLREAAKLLGLDYTPPPKHTGNIWENVRAYEDEEKWLRKMIAHEDTPQPGS